MVTISVTGDAEFPLKAINVKIDNLDNTNDIYYMSQTWFSRSFDLPSGRYMIVVSGMNRDGDKTYIEVSGDIVPNDQYTTERNAYAYVHIGIVE